MARRAIWIVASGLAAMGAGCSSPSSGEGGSPSHEVQGTSGGAGGISGATGGAIGAGEDASTTASGNSGGAGDTSGSSNGGSGGTLGGGGTVGGTGGGTGVGGAQGTGGGSCSDGYVDCNGDASGGCEVNANSDVNNCGKCGTVCPAGTNGTPDCFLGECKLACSMGFGDCNQNPADGCEANLLSDAANCGACGMSCGTGGCSTGSCQCATTSVGAKQVPLDMYILFDESGSMKDMVTGGTKWSVIQTALTSFVQNSGSAGMSVGIGYFPVGATSGINNNGSCTSSDYSTPDVPIGLLPGVATDIVNSLTSHMPGGGTPTYPALQGAYPYVTSWAAAHPSHKTILVLATDGDPEGCGTTNTVANVVTDLVTPALDGTPPILTFVIGVGSSLTSLNQIAAAGNTQQAFLVDTAGSDPGGQFLAAMIAIRGSNALGCDYQIPSPPSGAPDYSKVNVRYTPSSGSPTVLMKVDDASACTARDGGWYYDNNAAPTQIIACDSTCSAIQNDSGAKIDVLLGCSNSG